MSPSNPPTIAGQRPARHGQNWLVGASALVWTALGVQAGGPPTFYLIEPFLKKAVLVHFDTEANRRYDLEFSTNALSAPPGTWRSVYTVQPLPFQDHFIVYHETTNGPVGCFRLVATP